MHSAALDWVRRCRPERPGDVLDVGGRDVNGSPRPLFGDERSWTAVDLHDGPGVDVVGDVCALGLVDVADTVLCLEVLEHAEGWRDIVAACAAACRPDGTVIVTCAGPGREPHSAIDGGPVRDDEWYQNIGCGDLADAMTDAGLYVTTDRLGPDTRAFGRKQ